MQLFHLILQALPGVKHFIDHTCVPGRNSWVPWADAEEVFSTGKIHYAGQSIGLILAETPELALKAVDLVKGTFLNHVDIICFLWFLTYF